MRGSLILLLSIVALALLVPLTLLPNSYAMRVLILVVLFAAMGQAWNLVTGLTNQVSLGHAAFFGIGAYTSMLLLINYGISPWVGMLVGGIIAAAISLFLSYPTLRLRGHYFALATLGFGEAVRIVANSWGDLTGGPLGLSAPILGGNNIAMLQFRNAYFYYYITLAALILVSAVLWLIKTRRLGYYLMAVRENQDAAEVIGVNTTQVKVRMMTLSAFITAMLGALYAQYTSFIDPSSVFGLVSISVFMALTCIVGGLGTVWGPIVGAALLIPLQEFSSVLLGGQEAGLSDLFYGVLLIVIILTMPRGLTPAVQAIALQLTQRGGRHSATRDEGQ
jgi:branched-chain amino acid transport system permease protein